MWEQASIVFTGPIYCGHPPDCAIIQWSVHLIALHLVMHQHASDLLPYLFRVKNGGDLNNWIK